jgi:thiol-disulfide isomerase/thioredoxin
MAEAGTMAAKPTPPWVSTWYFIGRPDLFFSNISTSPRIWYPFLIPAIVAFAIPNYVFMQVGLNSALDSWIGTGCTYLYLLLQNALYATFAFGAARLLGGQGKFKTVFVACSFAQIPYILLRTDVPNIEIPTLGWSFVLTVFAVQQTMQLKWPKALALQLLLFVVSVTAILQGGNTAGTFIYQTLVQYEKAHPSTDQPLQQNPTGASEPVPQDPEAVTQNGKSPAQDAFDALEAPVAPAEGGKEQGDARHPAAPKMIIHTADGRDIPLSSLKGKVVVLDFWATWCAPCRRALPLVERVAVSERPKGVEFFAINTNESKDVAERYFRKNDLTLTLALDKDESNAMSMHAFSLPYIVVINKRGNIESVHEGYSPSEDEVLTMEIEAALNER